MLVNIDFETKSEIDIKKAGVHRYALDPSTDIICMGYMIDGREPEIWLPGQPFPKKLHQFVRDKSAIFCAWNAQFEIEIWRRIGTTRYGFPVLPPARWHDTMGSAAMCGFPLALDKCAKAIGADFQKDPQGTRLINKLSKPNKQGVFLKYDDCPEDFHKMYEYCKQDVRVEADVYERLPARVSGKEAEIQLLTWKTNHFGVPVDRTAVQLIKQCIDDYMQIVDHKVSMATNGELYSARQREALRKSITSIELPNMQGETIKEVLAENNITEKERFLLECYLSVNHASVAKFKRILYQLCPDGTVKSNLQYHGAGTGRDAARGFQLQNLPRATADNPELLLSLFEQFKPEVLDMLFPVLKAASSLIRPMIKAPECQKLIVSDFSQVEAVGTAWTAREWNILQNFRDGIDPYVAQAADMYHISLEEVMSIQRQYGKIAILACGYQGSHKALTDFALIYDLELEREEAVEIVNRFRKSRPKLVNSWYNFADAAIHAVRNSGVTYQPPGCSICIFQMRGEHLTMKLPSGRRIWYPYARVEEVKIKYEDPETGEEKTFKTNAVTCMWVSSYNHRWERRSMSGGNFFQNYVQGICRDLLMDAHIRCEKAGYNIVARVHDELIALCPDDSRYNIAQMNTLMAQLPEWAEDFPLKAAGYESKRYRK